MHHYPFCDAPSFLHHAFTNGQHHVRRIAKDSCKTLHLMILPVLLHQTIASGPYHVRRKADLSKGRLHSFHFVSFGFISSVAVNRIIDIIRNVSHGAATAPKVSYKNLSDSSTSNTLPGTKPLLGAAPGIPSVGVSEAQR